MRLPLYPSGAALVLYYLRRSQCFTLFIKLSLSVRSLFKLRPVRYPPWSLYLPFMSPSHQFHQLLLTRIRRRLSISFSCCPLIISISFSLQLWRSKYLLENGVFTQSPLMLCTAAAFCRVPEPSFPPAHGQSFGIVALALTLTDGSHRTKTKVAATKFVLSFPARAYKSVHNAKLRLNTYSSAGLPGSLCTGVRTRFHYGDFG